MNNPETRIGQGPKPSNPIRRLNAKGAANHGSMTWKLFELLKECKWIHTTPFSTDHIPVGGDLIAGASIHGSKRRLAESSVGPAANRKGRSKFPSQHW
jgi:hypothetical protein